MNSNEEIKTEGRKCRRWMIPFIVAAVILVKGGLVFLLWNALVPDLFHGPLVNLGQAIGLVILSKLFFGFGGPRGFGGGPFRHRGRWAHMSNEEREKLREELRNRC